MRDVADENALLRLAPSESTTLDVYELRPVLDRLTLALVTMTLIPSVTPDTPLIEAASLLLRTGRAVVLVVEGTHPAGRLTATTLRRPRSGNPPTPWPGDPLAGLDINLRTRRTRTMGLGRSCVLDDCP